MNDKKYSDCDHCEGKGYIEIRDCVGDIQYAETCSFCEGLGSIKTVTKPANITSVGSLDERYLSQMDN